MFDTHLHTVFSTDSKMTLDDAIKMANDQNIGLIVTEHMDLNYPNEGHFIFDVNEYFRTYEKYRNENLLLGLEMGLRPDCIAENRKLNDEYKFDYIIGSVHVVNTIDIFEKRFYSGRSKQAAYGEYFEYMLNCIKQYDFIDSLGHIDYIARYADYENTELIYDEFSSIIDKIILEILRNEIVIEINTRRLTDQSKIKNLAKIYNRYRELGGKYVTIGSDSHRKDAIGSNFDKAIEIVKACELKTVHFEKRKLVVD